MRTEHTCENVSFISLFALLNVINLVRKTEVSSY